MRGPPSSIPTRRITSIFSLEESGRLVDVPGDRVSVSDLPPAPPGTRVSRIDVIIRVTGEGEETGAKAARGGRTLE